MSSSTSTSALVGKFVDGGALYLVEILGSGGFGVVYRAVATRDSKQQFAVKVVVRQTQQTQQVMQLRELDFHARVSDHPNIVSFHRAFSDADHLYFVYDACLGGDLFTSVSQKAHYFYHDRLLKTAFVQLLDAVDFCHTMGIYHRDLKPENILSSADGSHLYLSDFGLATDSSLSTGFGIGSSPYMSPGELFCLSKPGLRG
jgi:serine/threonine protein kinase